MIGNQWLQMQSQIHKTCLQANERTSQTWQEFKQSDMAVIKAEK